MKAVANGGGGIGVSIISDHAHLRLTALGPLLRRAPQTDTTSHLRGEVVADDEGNLWWCCVAGIPGTWRKLGGPAAAGALHVLPTPVRVYDSRPATLPVVGPKKPLAPNVSRTFDLASDRSGVPAGATAALLTVLVVNAVAGDGHLTVYAGGTAAPTSNAMVWGDTARASTTATSALDAGAHVQVRSNVATDLVLDVVGYYV